MKIHGIWRDLNCKNATDFTDLQDCKILKICGIREIRGMLFLFETAENVLDSDR
jgi:hypothetical protein